MGEYVETMIQGVMVSLDETDKEKVATLIEMDDLVDRAYKEIKLYVSEISRQEIDKGESHRISEILSFATNLEHIGDITENLLELASKKNRNQLRFSDEGLAELNELHTKVVVNLKLAMTVFMSGDIAVARQLLSEKREVNTLERQGTDNHMERLREGRPECIQTSALYLDMLRDLRRIHSHIAAVAYPILDEAGELRKTRLKKQSS
jgi:phosphate:Na+ symporter